MGLFSSKWKMYAGFQTSPVYEDEKEFTTKDDIILRSVIQKTRAAKLIIHRATKGRNVDLARLFRYGRDTYIHGLPNVSFKTETPEAGEVVGVDLDNLKKEALKAQCQKFGIDFKEFENTPPSSYPMTVDFARYIPITKGLLDTDPEQFLEASYYAYTSGISGSRFKDIDVTYGEITFSENPLNFGLEKWRYPLPPPDPPEDEEGNPIEVPEIPEPKENFLKGLSFTLLPEQITANHVTKIQDGLFRLSIPATELMFAHIEEPDEDIEEGTYRNEYTFYANKHVPIRHRSNQNIVKESTFKVFTPQQIDSMFTPAQFFSLLVPSDQNVRASDILEYQIPIRKVGLVPMGNNHPNKIDTRTLEPYEVPKEAYADFTYNEEEYADLLPYSPFDVVIRENTTVLVIRSRFTDKRLTDPNAPNRPYDHAEVDLTSAYVTPTVNTGNGLTNPPSYAEDYLKGFPTVAFFDKRGWRDWVNKDTELSRQERTIGRIINVPLAKVAKEIRESAAESEEYIQYAFMNIGIDLGVKDPETKQFIYQYLEFLRLNEFSNGKDYEKKLAEAAKAREEAEEWAKKWGSDFRPSPFASYNVSNAQNTIAVSEWGLGYQTKVNWTFIAKTFYKVAHNKKRNSVVFGSTSKEQFKRALKELGIKEAPSRLNLTASKYVEGGIEEITIFGLSGSWYIDSWRKRNGGEWLSMEYGNTDKNIIFPMIYGLWRDQLLLQKEAASSRSIQLTITTAQWVKKKGWVRILQVVMIIITIILIVISIFFPPAGAAAQGTAGAAAGMGAAATGTTAAMMGSLIKTMVIRFIKAKIVSLVLEKIGEAIGVPYLSLLARLVQMYNGDVSFSFDAPSMLSIVSDITQGLGKVVQAKLEKIQKEMEQSALEFAERMKEIEEKTEANKLGNLEPEKLLDMVLETPNQFMSRAFADITETAYASLELDTLYNLDQYLLED